MLVEFGPIFSRKDTLQVIQRQLFMTERPFNLEDLDDLRVVFNYSQLESVV